MIFIMQVKIIINNDSNNNNTNKRDIKMNKGILLVNLVSSETLISQDFLMEDKNFIKKAKKLIKDKLEFYTVKDKLVQWCNNNY